MLHLKSFRLYLIVFLLPLAFFVLPNGVRSQDTPKEEVLLSAEVYFDFGKHDLRQESDSVLRQVTKVYQQNNDPLIRITAHTDSIGSLENNQALSMRRAKSVRSFLLENGLPESSISISVYGETRPAAANQTEEGRQRNRRAVIEVIKPMRMVLLEGHVTDAKTGAGLTATVIIRSKSSQDSLVTDSTGYFSKTLPEDLVIGIDAFSRCYFFKSIMLRTAPDPAPVVLPLEPALSGNALDLDNLYFVGNMPVLLPESKPELPKILQFMQVNDKMKIEIAGHVNVPNRPPVDRNSKEFRLSRERAKTVHDYLVEGGISADRIKYEGYGNWEMRFPNAVSEKQQALNRRVEIRVVEGGCE